MATADRSGGSPAVADSPSLMQQAAWAERLHRRLPTRAFDRGPLLWRVIRAEGGQMTSLTMRAVMRDRGVLVGDYTYGSLARPGGRTEAGTTIGRYVSVGPDCWVFRSNHPVSSASLHPYWYLDPATVGAVEDLRLYDDDAGAPCDIGHDAWIGANVVILRSCSRIGIGAIVGAGSVVTRDIPDFALAVGNPARVIRQRLSDSMAATLLAGRPWLLNPAAARRWYLEHELPENLSSSARGELR